MEFIGLENVTNTIRKFFDNNHWDVDIAPDTDFYYKEQSEKIAYSFVVPDRQDKLFQNYAIELGLNYNCDTFLLALLHEVGHHETLWLMDPDDRDRDELFIAELELTGSMTDETILKYYRCERERLATQWAVDFINKNPNVVREFWNELQTALVQFYDVNHIEA